MDAINILIGLNIAATFGVNAGGTKKNLKSAVTVAKEKPDTYLQKFPLVLSTLSLIALIFAVFQIGTLDYTKENFTIRSIALIIYLISTWFQVWTSKKLGKNYSQEVLIYRSHNLVTSGPFKFIRHPQYLSQIIIDIAGGIASLGYIVILIALIEIPFLIMRAKLEEKLLLKYFKEVFINYKKKSGFMIPFIG